MAVNGVSLRVGAAASTRSSARTARARRRSSTSSPVPARDARRRSLRRRGHHPARGRPRSPGAAWSARSRCRRSSRQLSALENVRVALQRKLGTSFHFWRSERSARGARRARASSCSRRSGSDATRTRWRSSCPTAASARSSSRPRSRSSPELMLLDEPTQGMGHEDVGRVVALIRRVAAGRTVLMVEHNLSVVQDLADAHDRARARERPRRGDLRRGLAGSRGPRGLHRSARRERRRRPGLRARSCASRGCTPSTASRTSSTAWTSPSARASS